MRQRACATKGINVFATALNFLSTRIGINLQIMEAQFSTYSIKLHFQYLIRIMSPTQIALHYSKHCVNLIITDGIFLFMMCTVFSCIHRRKKLSFGILYILFDFWVKKIHLHVYMVYALLGIQAR